MDKLFLDTNVLLDYLAARPPFDQDAKTIIQRAENEQIELFISVLSLCNISYILKKLSPGADAKQVLADLSSLAVLTSVDAAVIADALASSFPDFEDAVQHYSAFRHGGITHIITRNMPDFASSLIPVFTPVAYISANP